MMSVKLVLSIASTFITIYEYGTEIKVAEHMKIGCVMKSTKLCYVLAFVVVSALEHETWMCTTNTDARVASSCNKNLEEKVRSLEVQVQQLQKLVGQQTVSHFTTIEGFPKDCHEIYRNGTRADGLYSISPDGRCPFLVYCDMTNGGWTLIQKRIDDHVNFYRSWDDYVSGFGDIEGSHWLGLDKIHRLTKEGSQIYFDIENYDGTKDYAHYQVFTVHDAASVYKMNVDAFNYKGTIDEGLSFHNNMKFSTYDRDNDYSFGRHCCKDTLDGGGWWYNNCYRLGNVNGVFGKKETGGIGYWTSKNIPIKNVTIRLMPLKGSC